MTPPHPLHPLSISESLVVRDVIRSAHPPQAVFKFRILHLEEPPKALLTQFQELEHSGSLDASSPRRPHQVCVHYDVIFGGQPPCSYEVLVDMKTKKVVPSESVQEGAQPAFTLAMASLSLDVSSDRNLASHHINTELYGLI
ncbi:uncharacterized protein PG998_000142 [Apiospora kogelbergensis]|uniref:uncharacterized protein n=1 Tax=Apiospora kogelbergensis TaxID=1337665 RepID=UPI00312E3944